MVVETLTAIIWRVLSNITVREKLDIGYAEKRGEKLKIYLTLFYKMNKFMTQWKFGSLQVRGVLHTVGTSVGIVLGTERVCVCVRL